MSRISWCMTSSLAAAKGRGRERGWRGLSQTPRNRKSHSQHPKPPGKLAEAVRLRLDPEAPQTCRTHKVFPSRNDRTPFAALYRLSIPLARAHTRSLPDMG